jgi:hypothetical protein
MDATQIRCLGNNESALAAPRGDESFVCTQRNRTKLDTRSQIGLNVLLSLINEALPLGGVVLSCKADRLGTIFEYQVACSNATVCGRALGNATCGCTSSFSGFALNSPFKQPDID